jgi:hypothetical protein
MPWACAPVKRQAPPSPAAGQRQAPPMYRGKPRRGKPAGVDKPRGYIRPGERAERAEPFRVAIWFVNLRSALRTKQESRRGARAEPPAAWLAAVRLLVLASGGLCVTAGCSWIFVQPLSDDHYSRGYIDCTSSRTAPVIDTLFAVTNVASAIYLAGKDNVTNKGAAVTAGALVAGMWALSAGYGYGHTSACDAAKEEQSSGSYPLPQGLRARPQFYPQPPAVGAAPLLPDRASATIPVTAGPPAGAPSVAPDFGAGTSPTSPARPPAPQQQDSDDPGQQPARVPQAPQRLNAPRFGN